MNKTQYYNARFLNRIYETIFLHKELANVWIGKFRNNAASFRELIQRSARSKNFLHKGCGIKFRISRNILGKGIKVVCGFIRPDYFPSHFAIRFSTSS